MHNPKSEIRNPKSEIPSLDPEFQSAIEGWLGKSVFERPQRIAALKTFFSEEEVQTLEAARRRVRPSEGSIVYFVYENPFARAGGIYAVAENYGQAVRARHGDFLLLSPLHRGLATRPDESLLREVARGEVAFAGQMVPIRLVEHTGKNGNRWVLIEAEGYFEAEGGAGQSDPYAHAAESMLLRDSLFACAALPVALVLLGKTRDVVVHAQDWELASSALTVKEAILAGRLDSAAVVITAHNPYDQVLPASAVGAISKRVFRGPPHVHTVYQYMLPLMDGPITTVSRGFARELACDPLQTGHFANHLQDVLRDKGVVGVDNGLFGRPENAFSSSALEAARAGNPKQLLKEKANKRRAMLDVLQSYRDQRILGCLDGGGGRPLTELADDVPVFLMFGRLDPGQKGFDVLARAIEILPPGRARFVITPLAVSQDDPFLVDLGRLAAQRAGEVAIYPFRMEAGYAEAMAGATFAVMPSLYEPFGGATEPYLAGTPVVARRTGGLLQQVVDVDEDPIRATGLLFREWPFDLVPGLQSSADLERQWITIENERAMPYGRMRVPVYGAMVAALLAALTRASDIYRSEPAAYARLLSNVFDRAAAFSWERNVAEYAAVYQAATA